MSLYEGYPLEVQRAWQERRDRGEYRAKNIVIDLPRVYPEPTSVAEKTEEDSDVSAKDDI